MTSLLSPKSRFFIFLPLLILTSGCEDAIGLGGSCTAAMANVRRQEGSPTRTFRGDHNGNFQETWQYPSRVYTFRWGVSHDGCEVYTEPLSSVIIID